MAEPLQIRQGAMTDIEAAQYLGTRAKTLRDWRSKGKGPDYVKVGRLVRYLPQALDAFLEQNTVKAVRA